MGVPGMTRGDRAGLPRLRVAGVPIVSGVLGVTGVPAVLGLPPFSGVPGVGTDGLSEERVERVDRVDRAGEGIF